MNKSPLGKTYQDGEAVFRQGEAGNTMYVILSGNVDVLREDGGSTTKLSTLGEGDVFGEMALFEQAPRSATVRASGEAHILTIDKRTFFSRVHEDPSLAFDILKKMSQRIRRLDEEIIKRKA